jgi:quinol-cytochrome oxidoreductase complex cytochrome b subunit
MMAGQPERAEAGFKGLARRMAARIVSSRPWQSVVRHGWPDNPLDRSLVITSSLFLHLHSVRVSRRSLRWSYSFGLGIMATILFGVLTYTGVLLMFYYVPSVERAYSTMKELQFQVPLGQFTRNMHRWSAHAMVIVVVLHMLRVFYTGAYRAPREFNWILGVFLLLLTLGASFTGYLLPWDQLSFWAITVGTNIAGYAPLIGQATRGLLLGGPAVGQEALIRFYTLHVALLPLALIVLVSLHLWRVRKDGGLAASDPRPALEPEHGPS